MNLFVLGHATHPDWRMALALAAAQIDAQHARTEAASAGFSLGLVYLTDAYADHAEALLAELQQRWPGVEWVGSTGIGIAATGVEYFDEPALALLLTDLPRGQFQLYSGAQPLGRCHSALVHADGRMPDLQELLVELAGRTDSGYLFGGLGSGRGRVVHIAGSVYEGGLSGVAFGDGIELVSRVTQGCLPVGPARRVTRAEGQVVLMLDDRPALNCLLEDLGVDLGEPRKALPVLRATLAALSDPGDELLEHRNQFGIDTRVRHLIGLDPARLGVALTDVVETGMQLAFCRRDREAARRDLTRICAEIREELSPEDAWADPPDEVESAGMAPAAGSARDTALAAQPTTGRMLGAIYVSCAGRGGPHFGGASAELQLVRHALGEVPLIGFFAGGEIARHHLYGYTGVLTVFVQRDES